MTREARSVNDLCPVEDCSRPRHPDWTVCGPCAFQVEKDLGDVPALVEQLDITLSRQGTGAPRNGGRSSETPLAFDYGASEAMFVIHSTLKGWVREVVSEDAYGDPGTLASLLLAYRMDLVTHSDAADAVEEIHAATAGALRAIDRHAERMYAGQCMVEFEVGACTETLYALPGRSWVTCRACGVMHSVEERRAAILSALQDKLMTVRETARMAAWSGEFPDTARTEKLLGVWVARKRITAHGVDLKGRPTYRFGDTFDMLTASNTGTGPIAL